MSDFALKAGKPGSMMNHGINVGPGNPQKCPKCGSGPEDWDVENYDPIWRDGDVVCQKCRTRIRGYDAG